MTSSSCQCLEKYPEKRLDFNLLNDNFMSYLESSSQQQVNKFYNDIIDYDSRMSGKPRDYILFPKACDASDEIDSVSMDQSSEAIELKSLKKNLDIQTGVLF